MYEYLLSMSRCLQTVLSSTSAAVNFSLIQFCIGSLFQPRYVHLYCDLLLYSEVLHDGSANLSLPAEIQTIHIFTRNFFTTVQGLSALMWEPYGQNQQIFIFYDEGPLRLLIGRARNER